jgi:hypothetical protein
MVLSFKVYKTVIGQETGQDRFCCKPGKVKKPAEILFVKAFNRKPIYTDKPAGFFRFTSRFSQ